MTCEVINPHNNSNLWQNYVPFKLKILEIKFIRWLFYRSILSFKCHRSLIDICFLHHYWIFICKNFKVTQIVSPCTFYNFILLSYMNNIYILIYILDIWISINNPQFHNSFEILISIEDIKTEIRIQFNCLSL